MKKYDNVLGITVREMHSSFCNYQGIVFDTDNDIYMGFYDFNPKIPYIIIQNSCITDLIDENAGFFPTKLTRLSLIENEYMVNWAPDSIPQKWNFNEAELKKVLYWINTYWKNVRACVMYDSYMRNHESWYIPEKSPYEKSDKIYHVKINKKPIKKIYDISDIEKEVSIIRSIDKGGN